MSLHSLKTAHFLYPLKNELQDIDGICRRSVVHRAVVSVYLIVEHCGSDVLCVTDHILTDNNNGKTCRAHILLCACINESKLAYVNGFGKNAGRHISNEGHINIWKLSPLCTVNSVVEADVEIIRIGSALALVYLGDIREGLILGRSHSLCIAVAGSLLESLVSPLTCDSEVSLAAACHKVEGDHSKLCGCTALEEKYLVVVGNGRNLSQKSLSLINDRLILL